MVGGFFFLFNFQQVCIRKSIISFQIINHWNEWNEKMPSIFQCLFVSLALFLDQSAHIFEKKNLSKCHVSFVLRPLEVALSKKKFLHNKVIQLIKYHPNLQLEGGKTCIGDCSRNDFNCKYRQDRDAQINIAFFEL